MEVWERHGSDMKVLLVAVNAKYIHSNPAVYSLRAYACKYEPGYADQTAISEFTINQQEEVILSRIYKQKPDIAAFSCYIWNIGMIERITRELHKLLPETKLWFGGPEVSYDVNDGMLNRDFINGIIIGEGEQTFLELLQYYLDGTGRLSGIHGIAYREENGSIRTTAKRALLELDAIPFPYMGIGEFSNKIIYYETSRGCPFQCSYCLSSVEHGVRFRSMEMVREELGWFLEQRPAQVKFVDRTFNCSKGHAQDIWNYIKQNDNGITNFHFEISADLLRDEELNLLCTLRPGLVQLEIGVQTTNPDTIRAIRRKTDLDRLKYAVDRLGEGRNIHRHLDLIAGLPFEDIHSFRNSFNNVYEMRPEQLQLGFLKVLKGASVDRGDILYQSVPPYEVLSTKWLPYEELLKLKQVEEMVEVYYNSGQFTRTVAYLEHFFETPFDFYHELGKFYERKGLDGISHSRISRYANLLEFFKETVADQNTEGLKEIMVFDLYLRENLKNRPLFAADQSNLKERLRDFYSDERNIRRYLNGYEEYDSKQTRRMTHVECFSIDVEQTCVRGTPCFLENYILFDYRNRNAMYGQARFISIPL